jgi:membrane protein implicated in regulation of membrane protease activity
VIKEAKMHPIALHALRDIAEIAALGMFLIMIALAARAFAG